MAGYFSSDFCEVGAFVHILKVLDEIKCLLRDMGKRVARGLMLFVRVLTFTASFLFLLFLVVSLG